MAPSMNPAIFETVDIFWFITKKILPRIILIAAVFMVAFALRGSQYFFFLPLILAIILVYRFPPAIESLYILKKSGIPEKDKAVFLDLLRVSKDKISGVYRVGDSTVVKSYFKPFIRRYWNEFKSNHDQNAYEVFLHSKSKKEYNEHYVMLIELGYKQD